MKSSKLSLKATLLTSLIIPALIILSGCNNADAVSKTDKKEELIAIPVEVADVVLGDISSNYTTTTILEPKDEAEVISKASGIIEKIHVEEGDYVEAGTLLAEIEPERFQLNLIKAKAELSSLKHELERIDKVHNKQLVSTDTYDKLKWQYEAAKVNLDLVKLDLKETRIIAPISGYVAKRYVKEGNLVEQFQRQKLFHIVKQQSLQAIVNLPEQELGRLHVNQLATLDLTALPDKKITAFVERISPIIDSATGTFRVTLNVDNPNNTLKSGMFAEVKLHYDTRQNVTLLPRNALISMDNQHTVYVINEGKANKTEVTLGYQDEEFVEIIQGLNNGQKVVTTGQNNLKDQTVVEIIDAI
ncbi:efflux RND transporter periplasmic adaptor subunit [Colwelliaceae bacterium 6471]